MSAQFVMWLIYENFSEILVYISALIVGFSVTMTVITMFTKFFKSAAAE